MQQQLEHLERQYHDLTAKLSDPAVVGNQSEYQKIAKQHSDLTPIIAAYHQVKQMERELAESRDLLANESDAELQTMAREEIARLETAHAEATQALTLLLLPKDPNDNKNVVLEIRAGTGGEEAALFASDLFRMYSRYAETVGWRIEVMDSNPTGLGGLKEIIALIVGQGAYSHLKFEGGVHRVQRVPKTEASGRIHTSAVTVAVLPEAEDVDVHINESDLRVDVFRASGPGGQGVNTTDSAVRITHIPSGLAVACREERSQIKNKARAMKLLRAKLLEIEQTAQDQAQRSERLAMVGSGDRSEKIRTYNFPQNRITDHRIGLTLHQLDMVLEGKLGDLIQALRTHAQAEQLQHAALA